MSTIKKSKPIKRDSSLQPLSREHHHGLLLCWKIRQGFKKDIDANHIKKYCDWFWKNHLKPHFETEENELFIILNPDNENLKRALTEHRRISRLFESENDLVKTLSAIEEELENHIRFEERVLFNEIQKVATKEQLASLQIVESKSFEDNLTDPFWGA